MRKEDILNVLMEEIVNLTKSVAANLKDESLIKEVGLNSIDFVKLLVYIEEKFDILFEDDDLIISDEISLGNLAEKIEKYLVVQ